MFERLKRFIAAPEQKVSRTGALTALESGARWTRRDYAALTREGFCRNAVVRRRS